MSPQPPASRKHKLAFIVAGALFVAIAGSVLQTEMLGLVASKGFHKPIQVMYFTHCCMSLLFPVQEVVLYLRHPKRHETFRAFFRYRFAKYKDTAADVAEHNGYNLRPLPYLARVGSILALAVNLAGSSWYVAVNMTTTSDLTAIYNCSTFFAYLFSVLLLHEAVSPLKSTSVALSIVGVFIIAYMGGGSAAEVHAQNRNLGNAIIAGGSVLYGLYDVLYKKLACMPTQTAASRQACFSNLIGSCIGLATMLLMWPVLLMLHFTGVETFEIPGRRILAYLAVSVVGNVVYGGAFLVLMALTDPVLGSISTLIATCCVPFVEFVLFGRGITLAEVSGGLIIVSAFVVMAYADKL